MTGLLKAPVIIDKFHVVRMASDALERFRISMKEVLPAAQRRQLKSDRFAMLRRGENITDRDRLIQEIWFAAYPDMRVMYDLKEKFFGIFELEKRSEAEKEYQAREKSIPSHLQIWFKDLETALTNWKAEIFNYFDFHVTNAFTESANAKTRAIFERGKGYGFKVIRAKVLFNMKNLKLRERKRVEVTPDFILFRSPEGKIITSGSDIEGLQFILIEAMTPSKGGPKEPVQWKSDDSQFFIINRDQS